MTISELTAAVFAVRDDLAAGAYVKGWQDTMPVQVFITDTLLSLGFKATPGTTAPAKPGTTAPAKPFGSASQSEKDKLKSGIDECLALANNPPKATDGSGAVFPGDGSFIKAFFQFLISILPLLI